MAQGESVVTGNVGEKHHSLCVTNSNSNSNIICFNTVNKHEDMIKIGKWIFLHLNRYHDDTSRFMCCYDDTSSLFMCCWDHTSLFMCNYDAASLFICYDDTSEFICHDDDKSLFIWYISLQSIPMFNDNFQPIDDVATTIYQDWMSEHLQMALSILQLFTIVTSASGIYFNAFWLNFGIHRLVWCICSTVD